MQNALGRAVLASAFICFLSVFTLSSVRAGDREFVTVGTGGVTGVYYPAGSAVCRLVNKTRNHHGIRCSVEATGGSIANLNALRSGDLDFAIVQSDWQFHARNGTAPFSVQGPFNDLRAVFSLYPEAFTVVALKDAGISSFADIKGKRLNIGNPGSGARATMEVLMASMGWTTKDFAAVSEWPSVEQSQALCDRRVDVIVFMVGHPSSTIKEATSACDTMLVPVEGPVLDNLVRENAFFSPVRIPGNYYDSISGDIPTFAVRATLVTTASVPDDAVYQIVKAVFDNFDDFKTLHPALAHLRKSEMISASLSVPLHPGAERYFRQVGLLH